MEGRAETFRSLSHVCARVRERPIAQRLIASIMLGLMIVACDQPEVGSEPGGVGSAGPSARATAGNTATFAGGCFWCTEADFDKVPGVISTTSGYIGGTVPNPTYQQVSSGGTGHAEAVEIAYDPAKVSYAKLLDVFWRNVDPLVKDKQFCDSGDQYRTAIFYRTDEEKKLAEETKKKVEAKFAPRTVYTQIVKATHSM